MSFSQGREPALVAENSGEPALVVEDSGEPALVVEDSGRDAMYSTIVALRTMNINMQEY